MQLSDRDTRAALRAGRIALDPDDGLDQRIGPDSVDLRLGSRFLIFERNKQACIDPRDPATATGATRRVDLAPGDKYAGPDAALTSRIWEEADEW